MRDQKSSHIRQTGKDSHAREALAACVVLSVVLFHLDDRQVYRYPQCAPER
jgi:hypothetical protein